MNILFIGYWSVDEGLTSSTIFPHLEILSEEKNVKEIIFVSIERACDVEPKDLGIDKCRHLPLYSQNFPNKLVNKWNDFRIFPIWIKRIIKNYKIDLCIAAGTHAGALAFKSCRSTKIPFVVSYYDPHVAYMRELGVWKKYDPRYLMLLRWEKKLKREAKALFPVSQSYKSKLINEGVDEQKLCTTPCATKLDSFRPDPATGWNIRKKLLGFMLENSVRSILVTKLLSSLESLKIVTRSSK